MESEPAARRGCSHGCSGAQTCARGTKKSKAAAAAAARQSPASAVGHHLTPAKRTQLVAQTGQANDQFAQSEPKKNKLVLVENVQATAPGMLPANGADANPVDMDAAEDAADGASLAPSTKACLDSDESVAEPSDSEEMKAGDEFIEHFLNTRPSAAAIAAPELHAVVHPNAANIMQAHSSQEEELTALLADAMANYHRAQTQLEAEISTNGDLFLKLQQSQHNMQYVEARVGRRNKTIDELNASIAIYQEAAAHERATVAEISTRKKELEALLADKTSAFAELDVKYGQLKASKAALGDAEFKKYIAQVDVAEAAQRLAVKEALELTNKLAKKTSEYDTLLQQKAADDKELATLRPELATSKKVQESLESAANLKAQELERLNRELTAKEQLISSQASDLVTLKKKESTLLEAQNGAGLNASASVLRIFELEQQVRDLGLAIKNNTALEGQRKTQDTLLREEVQESQKLRFEWERKHNSLELQLSAAKSQLAVFDTPAIVAVGVSPADAALKTARDALAVANQKLIDQRDTMQREFDEAHDRHESADRNARAMYDANLKKERDALTKAREEHSKQAAELLAAEHKAQEDSDEQKRKLQLAATAKEKELNTKIKNLNGQIAALQLSVATLTSDLAAEKERGDALFAATLKPVAAKPVAGQSIADQLRQAATEDGLREEVKAKERDIATLKSQNTRLDVQVKKVMSELEAALAQNVTLEEQASTSSPSPGTAQQILSLQKRLRTVQEQLVAANLAKQTADDELFNLGLSSASTGTNTDSNLQALLKQTRSQLVTVQRERDRVKSELDQLIMESSAAGLGGMHDTTDSARRRTAAFTS